MNATYRDIQRTTHSYPDITMAVLEKLLYNLRTLAAIPKGRRIGTTKEFIVIEEDSPMQGVWRWKNSDSREAARKCICREVQTTITLAAYAMESIYLVKSLPPAAPSAPTTLASKDKEHYTLAPKGDNSSDCDDVALAREVRIENLKKIRAALLMASVGINNICQTYETDANFAGHLRPLLVDINNCTATITTLMVGLGEQLNDVIAM